MGPASYNHWSMRRARPLVLRLRRLGRAALRGLRSSLFVGVLLGLLSSLALERLKVIFSDHDLVKIDVQASQRVIAEFGILQVFRNGAIVEQYRFRDGDHASLELRLAPETYDIRIQVLTRQFSIARRQFGRASHSRLTDANLAKVEFFPDEEFVRVPGGRFRRGSERFPNARPPYELMLHAFGIRSIPVTSCEYVTYLAAQQNADVDDASICSGNDASKPQVYVTWAQAKDFCAWLSSWKGHKYRLPTEAEYERAMRISGGDTEYPWGNNEFDQEKPGVPLANYLGAWPKGRSPERTPVRNFPAIGGLYDIAGNIWEWTSDWYDPQYYTSAEARRDDPPGPGPSKLHQVAIRGGSSADPLYKLSCAFRGGVDPGIPYYNVGFRVVRE